MAFTKLLMTGDAVTELTGVAYRMLLVDSGGDVIELIHGDANKVLTSQGPSADPTWEDAAGGAHGLDAGQTDVILTSPVDDDLLAYDGSDWINQTAAEAGLAEVGHLLGDHGADTLANLNSQVSDATLDDASDPRDPNADSVGNAEIDGAAIDIAFNQIILTPKAAGDGTVEGTLFFDSNDDHVYVYVAA